MATTTQELAAIRKKLLKLGKLAGSIKRERARITGQIVRSAFRRAGVCSDCATWAMIDRSDLERATPEALDKLRL